MTSLCITLLPKSSLPRFPTTSLLYAGFFSDLVLLLLNRMNQYQLILKLTMVKKWLYDKKSPYSLALKLFIKFDPFFIKKNDGFCLLIEGVTSICGLSPFAKVSRISFALLLPSSSASKSCMISSRMNLFLRPLKATKI